MPRNFSHNLVGVIYHPPGACDLITINLFLPPNGAFPLSSTLLSNKMTPLVEKEVISHDRKFLAGVMAPRMILTIIEYQL